MKYLKNNFSDIRRFSFINWNEMVYIQMRGGLEAVSGKGVIDGFALLRVKLKMVFCFSFFIISVIWHL